MSTVVWPLDGVYGKNFRTSSSFGWRTHPITKNRKHHNGEDLVGQKYVKAIAGGTVIKARASGLKKSNGEPAGYGYFVVVRHMIDGVYYTSLYAHLKKGSFQVKKGDKIKAGKILAEMGTTGSSTGVHLHLEIWMGKVNGWSADGSGFVDPIPFIKAHIDKDAVIRVAKLPTPQSPKRFSAPASKPKYTDAMSIGDADRGEDVAYLQKFLGIAVDGIFGPQTHRAVLALQRKHTDLIADGVVGPVTWSFVNNSPAKKPVAKPKPKPKPAPAPAPAPKKLLKKVSLSGWLKRGSRGDDVAYLQQELGIKADGIFGPQTDKAVRAFQKLKKIKVDGIVGPVTWGKL